MQTIKVREIHARYENGSIHMAVKDIHRKEIVILLDVFDLAEVLRGVSERVFVDGRPVASVESDFKFNRIDIQSAAIEQHTED